MPTAVMPPPPLESIRAPRPHFPMGFKGALALLFGFSLEVLRIFTGWSAARRGYLQALAKRGATSEPWVACVSDNLDEVNGIALASRIQLRELRSQGKQAFLFGTAFHTRSPRDEGPDAALVLAPGRISADQAGYDHSELAVVRIDAFFDFLCRHPVDIVEIQTPGPTSVLCLIASKTLGIRTLSHYRTDILVYSEMLMKHRFGKWFVQSWTRWITRLAGPVIVPSEAYREKVIAMGVRGDRIHKLPRGVDLAAFHPRFRDRAWIKDLGIPEDGFLLLYVGRISAEKNLAELATAFKAAVKQNPELRLAMVGDGPYRLALENHLRPTGRAHFTGMLTGEALARAFASADLFVFPSLTDTFGNSVVEALASGLPCLVSDQGGPQEIVLPGICGDIFEHRDPHALRQGILALSQEGDRLRRYREATRTRAEEFTHPRAARAFWNFYQSLGPTT